MNPINLAESCGPMEFGSDVANLVISVQPIYSFSEGTRWGVIVEKPTFTAPGRKGKPARVATLVANDDQGVPELLRSLAFMWEKGEVVPGQTYGGDGR